MDFCQCLRRPWGRKYSQKWINIEISSLLLQLKTIQRTSWMIVGHGDWGWLTGASPLWWLTLVLTVKEAPVRKAASWGSRCQQGRAGGASPSPQTYLPIYIIKYENAKFIIIFVWQIDPLHFPKRAGPWDCNLPFSLLTRGTSNVHAMITVCTQWSPDARPGITQFTAYFAPWPIVSQTCT